MALIFTGKTFEEILNDVMTDPVYGIPNTIDKRPLSLISMSVRPFSWVVARLYIDLEWVFKNGYIRTATGEALEWLAEERGLFRRPATFAVRLGIFDAPVEIGYRFSTPTAGSSVIFSVTKLLGLQDDGFYHAELTCEESGTIGNEYVGIIVQLTYVPQLGYAYLSDIIVSGANIESDDELRQRYIDSLLRQPFAGNIAAYVNWFIDGSNMNNRNADNIGAVQVYPHASPTATQINGHVTCSAIDRNYMPLSQTIIDELQYDLCPPEAGDINPSANGYGYAPIGAIVHVVTPTQFTINVTVQLQLRTDYTIPLVQNEVNAAIESYFADTRRLFGQANNAFYVDYEKIIHQSRISAAVLSVEGVLNVISVQLNNAQADIELVATSVEQQLPILGEVTLNV